MRKRSLVTLAVVTPAIIASVTRSRLLTRPIPFDGNAWRSGDAKMRFRMKDSLLAKHAAGGLATRADVDSVLGSDDDPTDAPEYRYFRLKEWYGNPWYLRVTFDADGQVTRFIVAPD